MLLVHTAHASAHNMGSFPALPSISQISFLWRDPRFMLINLWPRALWKWPWSWRSLHCYQKRGRKISGHIFMNVYPAPPKHFWWSERKEGSIISFSSSVAHHHVFPSFSKLHSPNLFSCYNVAWRQLKVCVKRAFSTQKMEWEGCQER